MNCYAAEWREFVRLFHPELYDLGMAAKAFSPKPKARHTPENILEWFEDNMARSPGDRAYRRDMLARAQVDLNMPNLSGKFLVSAFRKFAPDAADGQSFKGGRYFQDWRIDT